MMNDIVRRQTSSGQIEVYDASQKLTDETTANFEERGRFAADLLIATLTETPYTPVIDGVRYEVPVANRYMGVGVEEGEEQEVTDTVDEARVALAEFLAAKVPGSRSIRLRRYKTKYQKIYDDLSASGRAERPYQSAFDEAFVESARRKQVDLSSPQVGKLIIARAPHVLYALPLEERDGRYTASNRQRHDAITEAGRLITVISYQEYSGRPIKHYLSQVSRNLSTERRGRAPGSTISHKIEERVVDLRTRHTKA